MASAVAVRRQSSDTQEVDRARVRARRQCEDRVAVCRGVGRSNRAREPVVAMRATTASCAFESAALVTTTPIVVFSPSGAVAAGGCRSSVRASANPSPSSVRAPATMVPVSGSTTSPTAFTAINAATCKPPGTSMSEVPMPPFIARPGPPSLPTVAPAPAPTLPSSMSSARALSAPPHSRTPPWSDRRIADPEVVEDRGGHDRHPGGAGLEGRCCVRRGNASPRRPPPDRTRCRLRGRWHARARRCSTGRAGPSRACPVAAPRTSDGAHGAGSGEHTVHPVVAPSSV